MVSQEIRNCGIALGALMHQVNEEQAAMLRLIKTNLVAAADHAEELEHNLIAPKPGQGPAGGVMIADARANIEMMHGIVSDMLTDVRAGHRFVDSTYVYELAKALDHLVTARNEVKDEDIQKAAD